MPSDPRGKEGVERAAYPILAILRFEDPVWQCVNVSLVLLHWRHSIILKHSLHSLWAHLMRPDDDDEEPPPWEDFAGGISIADWRDIYIIQRKVPHRHHKPRNVARLRTKNDEPRELSSGVFYQIHATTTGMWIPTFWGHVTAYRTCFQRSCSLLQRTFNVIVSVRANSRLRKAHRWPISTGEFAWCSDKLLERTQSM